MFDGSVYDPKAGFDMEIDMSERTRQLFILPPEIWASINREEIAATTKVMLENEIYNYPYEEFDINACGAAKDIMPWVYNIKDNDHRFDELRKDTGQVTFSFRYYNMNGMDFEYAMGVHVNKKLIYLPHNSQELLENFGRLNPHEAAYMNDISAAACLGTLMVMLATKNVEKQTLENARRYKDPLSKNGIKQIKNESYKYITTIKIGKITESMPSDGSRGSVRPHLRRGHMRTQHYGVGNKETKNIFIQPVFVNADEGWLENQRKAYVIKAA